MGDKRDRQEPPSISYMVTVYQWNALLFLQSSFRYIIPPLSSLNISLQNRTWLQPGGCLINMFYILNYLTLTYFINSDLAFLHCWSSEKLLHPITCLCHWINSMEGLLQLTFLAPFYSPKIFAQSMARLLYLKVQRLQVKVQGERSRAASGVGQFEIHL